MSNNLQVNIHEALQEHFIPYAGEILINNLPSIDGCLPVHRKAILSMYRNGRTSNRPYTKTMKVMGEIVTYYVFGDSPLYNAMVNMANNSMNIPYIDGYGEWGEKFSAEGVAAAPRYTECRLTKYAEDMIAGLNKNNVPMKPNFDHTTDEMIVMPSLPPNILLNTSQSIAVGEASKIPAHNVIDTCDSIIHYINTRNIDEVIEILKCPDLSSGGQIVYNKKTFEQIYKTGKGSFTLIGKYRFDEKTNTVQIYEVPYETTIHAIEDKLRLAYEKGQIKEIVKIRNGTGNKGLRLDITLKRGADVEKFIAKLRKYTPFESKMSCNFTILDLDWKTPKLMSLEDIYKRWLKHRYNCITAELQYDIDKKSKKLHELKGLEKVLLDIDKTIQIIRNTSKENEVIQNLMSHLQIDEEQAQYIAEIKLRNLNKEYIIKRTNEIEVLEKEINDLTYKLNNPKEIKKIIIDQLEYVKKTYGQLRKTDIIYADEIESIDTKELEIENYNIRLFVTKQGYLKKIPSVSLRGASNVKLKDDDKIVYETDATNKSDILIFTDKQNCYKLKAYEIDDHKPSMLGEYLPSTLGLKDENIVYVTATEDYEGYLIIGFDNGKVAKIELSSYKSNRSMLKNAYTNQEKPIYFDTIKNDIDLVVVSTINKVLVFNTNMINAKSSKTTIGVQVMKSKNDSKVKIIKRLDDVQLQDVDYYRTSSAAVGKYLKKGDII